MVVSKNKLLIELINKQRTNIDSSKKLDIKDLHRICKNLNSSIFANTDSCCLWCGYVTNIANSNTKYINFFFKKKKYALHRLLYENFVDNIDKSEYLRFTCENKGVCCNLNHITKIGKKLLNEDDNEETSYVEKSSNETKKDIVLNKKNDSEKSLEEGKSEKNNSSIEVIKSKNNLNKLIIIF